tara:strand:- start:3170 stop:6355 length:3186 start_codon:yes stop_codon:yes gene_type:complete
MSNSINNLRFFLKEMFQFNENDLDFGIYKIYNLKRKQIESFIDGEEENDLKPTIEKILKEVNLENQKTDSIELYNFLKGLNQDKLLEDPEGNYQQLELFIGTEQNADKKAKLVETLNNLSKSKGLTDELKDKIYNHILGFFQMYYSNGDFGYNDRSRDIYKVPYEADYNGSDTMFHWKHKGSLYIKTGTSFNAIKFELDGNKIEFRLETNTESENEEVARNNNKDSQLKHYRLDRVEQVDDVYQVIFNLSDTSTPKADIFKAIYKVISPKTDIENYLTFEKDGKQKSVFVDLTKDFDKVQNGQIKGLSALRQKKKKVADSVKKNFERGTKLYDENEKNFLDETLAQLYTLDQKLNSFYIGNDADYFIHENLNEFLTNEKQRYVKNYIFDDLQSIYDGKLDNTTLLIAKAFDKVSSRIIEFLSAIEDFQKHLFTKKKKVVESEYCITLDYMDEKHYPEILKNKAQLQEWKDLFNVEVKTIEDLKDHPTLVLDTKFFREKGTNKLKDDILAEIDDLDEKTNGLLINSENLQGLTFISNTHSGTIDNLHIDPPYNTSTSGFLYKNEFKHSSWLAMMHNRLKVARDLMASNSSLQIHIDENEYENLHFLCKELELNNHGTVIWDKRNPVSGANKIATQHEYVLNFTKGSLKFKKEKLNGYKILDKAAALQKKLDLDTARKELKSWLKKQTDFSGGELAYNQIDDDGRVYQSVHLGAPEQRTDKKFFVPLKHPVTKKDCPVPKSGWGGTPEFMQELVDNNEIIFGSDETSQPRRKYFLENNLIGELSSLIYSGAKGKKQAEDYGFKFPYNHPVELYEMLKWATLDQKTGISLDFFAGSGTSGHAIINLNKKDQGNRKYVLIEMGSYFNAVTKKRIVKAIYSSEWKKGKPVNNNGSERHIFKYEVLEQYEDLLDNLTLSDNKSPENLPLKYLYKPEENSLDSTIDLFIPFDNKVKYGQPSQEGYIDLVETYNFFLGYYIKSIKAYDLNDKYYKVVETANGVLVVWRDVKVNEDDSEQVIEIASNYNDIHTIEVNAEFANLHLDKNNQLKVGDNEIELKIITKEVFNQ